MGHWGICASGRLPRRPAYRRSQRRNRQEKRRRCGAHLKSSARNPATWKSSSVCTWERYYAPSPGTGPWSTGYYLTNVVLVKKWLKQTHSALAVRAVGTAEQGVSRAQMPADFRAERPDAIGSSLEAPMGSQITASPDASHPSTASRWFDRIAGSPPISPNLPKRRIAIPGPPDAPERSSPLSTHRPPRGAVSRGCEICMAAYSEVSHPWHSEIPGKRYCPSSGV